MPHKQTKPIELHYWPTPNGWKVGIYFEETSVPYEIKYVNIGKGEQFTPEFLAIAPNNRMPAIVDPEGPDGKPISVFESGAILLYLGRKFGAFYPTDERRRVAVDEWLMWQTSNVGPVFGHNNHFRNYAPEKVPYGIKRFGDEAHRLMGVFNKRLAGRDYVADEYSIADMMLIGWMRGYERQGLDIAEFPNVKGWIDRMMARPAVARATEVGAEKRGNLATDKEAQKILFGQRAR